MRKDSIDVVFDRRKLFEKRGEGYLEVKVYLGRTGRRYITVCASTPDKWEEDAKSEEIRIIVFFLLFF